MARDTIGSIMVVHTVATVYIIIVGVRSLFGPT